MKYFPPTYTTAEDAVMSKKCKQDMVMESPPSPFPALGKRPAQPTADVLPPKERKEEDLPLNPIDQSIAGKRV